MIGDLLGAGRSLSFFYQRSMGSVFINGTGSTSLVNPKIAENNSPLPEDRVSFRYNYFAHALSIVGESSQTPVFDPTLGLTAFSAPRFRGLTATKTYSVDEYTFSAEKTCFDRRFSVEMRVPFNRTLSSNLDLSVARVSSIGLDSDMENPNSIIQTTATPQNTFGNSDTEFGNMSFIFKGLAYQSHHLAVSGGFAVGIPTARDTRVRVTDFLGDAFDNDIEVLRQRQFHISNNTWEISPFVAVLALPSEKCFIQGFAQFDIPLNSSSINYSEAAVINTEPNELTLNPLFTRGKIREQTLMQLDLGTGYWLMHNPDHPWLTGLAPTVELHYTNTLNNADIVSLPLSSRSATLNPVAANGTSIEPNPTVGNLRNRLDILNLTLGTTFEFCNRTTLATAVSLPLRGGDNKLFDWEFQIQLNYYFGGPRQRPAPAFQ
jgi:hypothetical protein